MQTPVPNIQGHATSDVALALTTISICFGKLVELLVSAEPVLASLSYIVAIAAGAITIFYKWKRKG